MEETLVMVEMGEVIYYNYEYKYNKYLNALFTQDAGPNGNGAAGGIGGVGGASSTKIGGLGGSGGRGGNGDVTVGGYGMFYRNKKSP
jgi:hypothetical protein